MRPHAADLVVCILLAVGLASCGAQQTATREQDIERAQAELREVSEVTINENFANKVIDPIEPHIAEDVATFGPSARELRIGKTPMMESLRGGVANRNTTRWEERDWHIQVYDDVGIVTFLYDHDGTRGGRAYERTYRATYVFHWRDDRWQMVHDHTSARPPEPGS